MFTTGETVGLAEWIIDDICLVEFKLESVTSLKYLVTDQAHVYVAL